MGETRERMLRAERSGLGHQRHHQASSEERGHLRVGSWADDSVEVPACERHAGGVGVLASGARCGSGSDAPCSIACRRWGRRSLDSQGLAGVGAARCVDVEISERGTGMRPKCGVAEHTGVLGWRKGPLVVEVEAEVEQQPRDDHLRHEISWSRSQVHKSCRGAPQLAKGRCRAQVM